MKPMPQPIPPITRQIPPARSESRNKIKHLLGLAAVGLLAASAIAADATWTNVAANSTWVTDANWDPNAAPGATNSTTSTDTATFYSGALTAARVVTVDANRNVRNITFSNSTTGFTLQLTGGSLLPSAGGQIELLGSATANIQTFISSPVTLQGNYTILNNGGNTAPTVNPLEFQGGAVFSGAASLGAVTLTLGGTNGNFAGKGIIAGVISNGVGNTLSIVKQDSGNWQFNGANTFTGGVTIKQGGMIIGNATGLGPTSVPVTFGDSATGQDVLITTGSGITIAHAINVMSGAGNRLLTHVGGGGNGTYSGLITLNKDVMLRNFSGSSTRTLNFSGTFAGNGNIIITNGGAGVGNTAVLSGTVTNNGTISNVSTLGDATISGVIGTNVTGVVQNSATSILNINGAANTYTAGTIISAGTLKLGATGSIASSTNISVVSGATFDVSVVTGGFTLANGQTLQGEGTVNGNLAAASGATVSPAGSGVAGTLFFNNNLNTSAGGSLKLDVSTSSGAGNDAVSAGGTLTAGGTITLRALSGASNLDTNADYVLVTAGSISGSFASTPAWEGTAPANASNFSIVTSGTQVTLHYNPSVPPTVTANANPSSAVRGQSTTITAIATPGSSAISTVVVDLTSLGGSSSASLVLSNANVYTNTFTVSTGSALGGSSLAVIVTDVNTLQGSFGISFTVLAALETWNGAGANDDWGTAANWTNGIAPLTDDLVFFDGSTRTSPNLETSYSVAGLTFNNGAASFNIGTGNGSTLTVTGGITNDSANAQTLSALLATSTTEALPVNTAAGNVTLAGAISDSGFGIVKLGGANLTLSAANTYSGTTVISNGTLTLSGSGTLGGGSSPLTTAGGALNLGGTSQTLGAATIAGGTVSNGTLTASSYALQSGTVSASLAGSGIAATKTTTNALVLSGNNTFDGGLVIANTSAGLAVNGATALGLGSVNFSSGGIGGSFDCTAASAISNANNNALIISGDTTFVGSQSLNLGTGNVNMGSLNKTLTVASNTLEIGGNISNSANSPTLSKAGAGTLILSGASTYVGPTAVNGGTLLLNGSLASLSPVTVASSATLGGNGSISGPVTINAGGTLSPGTSVGTLTVNSDLALSGNLFVEINKALAATNDYVVVTGALTNAGTGTLTLTNLNPGQPLAAGDSFKLFSQPLLNGGSLTLTPATPGTGLAWNNQLAVDGTIAVITGIATNATNITFAASGGNLTLSWPADHTGWTLQTQTNALSVGLNTNWFPVAGSSATNQITMPVGSASSAVFFRLIYP
jgi:fibronectin-binding autotransporter adhesin